MAHVACHMSHVTCQLKFSITKKNKLKIGQRGGASRWRVCYQRGLPRLVIYTAAKQRGFHSLCMILVTCPNELVWAI